MHFHFHGDHPGTAKDNSATPPNASNFVSHPHVRENELKIWDTLLDEVANTINHLKGNAPVHIVEIGGSSLQGLSLLRGRGELQECKYTIVDREPPHSTARLKQLEGVFISGSAADLRQEQLHGQIDLVIGMRALEYDPLYGRTLTRLNQLSAQRAYGIFVHNSSESPIFPRIEAYRLALCARITAIETLQEAIRGDITIPAGLSTVRES
jgi:hypothetical protein